MSVTLRRLGPAGPAPAEPGAVAVLVSHWHEDHLDTAGVSVLDAARPVVVGA